MVAAPTTTQGASHEEDVSSGTLRSRRDCRRRLWIELVDLDHECRRHVRERQRLVWLERLPAQPGALRGRALRHGPGAREGLRLARHRHLQAKLGCPVQADHLEQLRRRDRGDGAPGSSRWASSARSATSSRTRSPMRSPSPPSATPAESPTPTTAGIWVPKNSSITSLKQLSGKTLALSSTTSTSGGLYPISALINAGFKCTPQPGCQGVTIKFAGQPPRVAACADPRHGRRGRGQQPAAGFGDRSARVQCRRLPRDLEVDADHQRPDHCLRPALARLPGEGQGRAARPQRRSRPRRSTPNSAPPATGPMVAASDALYNQVRAVAKAVHLNDQRPLSSSTQTVSSTASSAASVAPPGHPPRTLR